MTRSVGRQVVHVVIRLYQLTFSALIGRQCRYAPSCSHYLDEAVARHGVWAGTWMGAARVCRCHPWGDSGFDPVPSQRPEGRWFQPWRYGVRHGKGMKVG